VWATPLLVALLAIEPAGDPDVSRRIEALGAPRYAEREAAAEALRTLGAAALPALRAARAHADAEVRARAAALVREIEARTLREPTRLHLDGPARPLRARLDELAERGLSVTLDPTAAGRGPAPLRIDAQGEDLTFWELIGRAERTLRLRAQVSFDGSDGDPQPRAGLVLVPDDRPETYLVSDRGPFRVKVVGAHYRRDRWFEPNAPEPGRRAARQSFQLDLQVLAEPGLFARQAGPVRLLEATDDSGATLAQPARAPDDDEPFDTMPMLMAESGGYVATTLDLALARPGARSIRLLRGSIPLSVARRRGAPLDIPLRDAAGRRFPTESGELSVLSIHVEPDGGPITIELALRPRGDEPAPDAEGNPWGDTVAGLVEHQFEVVDARGRALPALPMDVDDEAGGRRLTLAIMPDQDQRRPERLRFYDLVRAEANLEFTLNEIPMP
jgi:hypothetical protein